MADKTQMLSSETLTQEETEEKQSKNRKRALLQRFFAFLRSRQDPACKNSKATETRIDSFHSDEATILTPQERLMLNNVLELHQARVDDVMIARPAIEAMEMKTTLAEALDLLEKSGHSRMPVYAETLDDPRGMIHIRDVLNHITLLAKTNGSGDKPDLSRIDLTKTVEELHLIRDILFVPVSMPASQLLTRMQASHTQIALVIDEHGGTDGLVSMEDIVELIVGDIEDEHDNDAIMIVMETENSWLVNASTELKEIEKIIGLDFNPGIHSEDADTIGGIIVSALDRIPACGEITEIIPGYRIQILEADPRRIKQIRISRMVED